jgi:hypothetical protein
MDKSTPSGNLTPFGDKVNQFQRAIVASENAASKGAFKEAFKQQGEAMRAMSAILGILSHTLNLSVKEQKEQADKILELEEKIENIIPSLSSALAERYINTKEQE